MSCYYYTRYAQFFNDNIENNDYYLKDEHSWPVFLAKTFQTPSLKIWQDKVIMTKDLQQAINSLVIAINKKIKEVISNDNCVVFINYDQYFRAVRRRFCTKGVNKGED